MDRRLVIALAMMVLIAGCEGVVETPTTPETGGTSPEDSDAPREAVSSTAMTASSPNESSTRSDLAPATVGERVGTPSYTGTIAEVVDGDTVDVRLDNGTVVRVRLLGADAPEARGENEPEEFEGVPDTASGAACLREAAREATAFAETRLGERRVHVVFDAVADRRGGFGRLLAYIVVAGRNFNYQLVRAGHARVYETEFTLYDRFTAAEASARASGEGLWRCRGDISGTKTRSTTHDASSVPLAIDRIHEDAEGNDHENRNDEYIVFRNLGDDPLDLSGWTVRDDAGHSYRFPDGFVLASNATVTLYTGSGQDTEEKLHWGAETAIWNNDGDTIIVRNESGAVVLEKKYS